jgi:phospholipid/cholesterol/gamma-HCH transport system substrate-binding protein
LETKANYIIVGIVTMVVLLASFAFVYWIARGGDAGNAVPLEIRIPGSVTGLAVGSQVLFNGIKVGDVRRLSVDAQDPEVVIVNTLVERTTPITPKTKASLGFQGLTGQAYIELKGGDPTEQNILEKAAQDGGTALIEADIGAVNNLIDKAQAITARADRILLALEKFVDVNQVPLTETVANARKFSDALARNGENIDLFLTNVGELSKTLGGVSARLDTTLTAAEDLLKSVDRTKVDTILANAQKVSDDLAKSSGEIDTLVASVQTSVKQFGEFTGNASKTFEGVDKLVAAVDPAKVSSTLENIDSASKTARTAIDDISRVSTKFGARAEDIDDIVTNVKDLTGRLNQTSVRLDGVLAKVDGFLGTNDGAGATLVEDARATLLSFRKVADTLNSRLGEITNGLAKFTGRGLNDIQSAVQDSRRSISRIESAISNLERNPERLIFGGTDSVPRTDGRNRR